MSDTISSDEETDEHWDAAQELTLALRANDTSRVRYLFETTCLNGADATRHTSKARHDLPLLHCLLEHGADANSCSIVDIDSFETLKLLAEYGCDMRPEGHMILQDFVSSREALDWLLDRGVDINDTDYGRTEGGFALASPRDTSLKVLNGVAARGDIELYDHLIARGADRFRSLGLHSVSRCEDPEKSLAMIDHLLDTYHMNIELDDELLRNNFDRVGSSGTPLQSAVYYKNLTTIHKLLARGAQPEPAISGAIGNRKSQAYLPALCPLLDAGADLGEAFNWAVLWGNPEAARICLERGADPTKPLEAQRAREARKATRLNAERSGIEIEDDQRSEEPRLPRGKIMPKMEEFLRSLRSDGSCVE